MTNNKLLTGHIAAMFTILVWGTTFISTKILLNDFTPIEILFIRFVIGYFALWIVYPYKLKLSDKKQEGLFALAGLCGITLYYLFENIALTYTLASNVGVIVSISPFFTAMFSCLALHNERPDGSFFIGFVMAMAGICLISFNSDTALQLNPLGDILAVAAAIIWAVYSLITKKISALGYNTVQITRRTFFYGLLFMLPVLGVMGFNVSISKLSTVQNIFNLLFLGFCASALCFVTWNVAVKFLGPIKTSVYIYMVPVITVITAIIILHEKITLVTICGIVLTLMGLFLSEGKKTVRFAFRGPDSKIHGM